MLRRLLSHLGYEPRQEAEVVRRLKRLAEQLNERAARFRVVVERRVLLEQRVEQLEFDWARWERETVTVQPDLAVEVARICGRIEGQLQESRAELALLVSEEESLRNTLTSARRVFDEGHERARRLGHDVSRCRVNIDLSSPERVPDLALLADDDRSFLARIIDGARIH